MCALKPYSINTCLTVLCDSSKCASNTRWWGTRKRI